MGEIPEMVKQTILEMVCYIAGAFPIETHLFEAVHGYFEDMTPEESMAHVAAHIKPQAAYISTRDLDFFKTKRYEIFNGIPRAHIDRFAEMALEADLESLNTIWTYFSTILALYDLTKPKLS